MVVVSVLTALLAAILGAVWTSLCFPSMEVAARCRLALEATLAAASLARDCGGYFGEPAGSVGTPDASAYLGCAFADDDPGALHLKYEGQSDVVYKASEGMLVRSVGGGEGTWSIVASGLTAFGPAEADAADPGPAVSLTFEARGPRGKNLSATYILVTPAP